MDQLTVTPFGRQPVTAGLMARAASRHTPEPSVEAADKWQVLRDLTAARGDYGLSDRSLMVLGALLSFHPDKDLAQSDNLIVFPSNRILRERCHGMAESTLRRHLAKLIEAGLLLRHDSPNGKRYARRYGSGDIAHAFGFDLSPLRAQAADIIKAADQARNLAAEMRMARERIAVLRRDVIKLSAYAKDHALPCPDDEQLMAVTTLLRRKLTLHELRSIEAQLVDNLTQITAELAPETAKSSGSDNQNERHYQNSNKDSCESEQPLQSQTDAPTANDTQAKKSTQPNTLPLPIVLDACSELRSYHQGPITGWDDFIRTLGTLRAMIGITQGIWDETQRVMGPQAAAVTLACVLQRFTEIRNPNGYLKSLTHKAKLGKFSTAPMVMALINTANSRPS